MCMLLYFLGFIIWMGVYIAYMQVNKGDSNLWEKSYSSGDLSWKDKWVVFCIFGAMFWPLAIPIIFIYKLAFKFFSRSK